MSVKDVVKRTWPFDKAEKIKNLYFEKLDAVLRNLDAVLRKVDEHDAVLASLAANDTSVMQALVFLVDRAQAGAAEQDELRRASEEARRAVGDVRAELATGLKDLPRARWIETDRYEHTSPEIALLAHLAPHLPARKAIDVGANVGDVSAALLASGFEVHAFEPFEPVREKLRARLGSFPAFHLHPEAVGREDCEMDLHVAADLSADGRYQDASLYSTLLPHSTPADLPFVSKTRVRVRSLESLRAAGEIPPDVSLVKVDAEGFDLEVLRGMGGERYAVVAAEFWDREMDFGKSGTSNHLDDLVAEMRERGYLWHIVVYRIWGDHEVAYYCELARAIERSWGNVFFFRDHELFSRAEQWCAAALRRTYFKLRAPKP
jgi:FkbM family methyltransferase